MNEKERSEILLKAKSFFRTNIVESHIKNTLKLKKLKAFNVNPFLEKYLANFAFGNASAENIAKALLYPRILGTSINTSFGTHMQNFCNDALAGYASVVQGIDIEFIDAIDKRKKYCQIKSGPNTINHDDVTSIKNHFRTIRNLARTNHLTEFNPSTDCIVCVFYGTENELSACYKKINEDYPVYIGKEFWHRLTGDENFYSELINAFASVANEMDSTEIISEVIAALASEIEEKA